MLINKRIGVFETNSSSSHSISISNEETDVLTSRLDITEEDDQKIIYIECDEFGWDQVSFSDAETKLSYLMTHLFQMIDKENVNLPYDELTDCMGIDKKDTYEKLERIICEFCNADKIIVRHVGNDHWYPFGYIDHQSSDIAPDILNKSDDYILNFIFNPRSILFTDNDNH